MRTKMTAQPQSSQHPTMANSSARGMSLAIVAILAAGAMSTAAQRPATQPPAVHQVAAAKRLPHQKKVAPPPPPAQPAQELVPPAPPPPNWPANDQPTLATVVWNSQGLRIDASNSSLQQILREVSTETGARVEGLHADQRIFGSFGPGPARDVLTQLLDGSGYNVLMIGDQGQGTPREIVLSERPKGPQPPVPPSQNLNAEDNNNDVAEQPQPQPPPQPQPMPNATNGFNPGAPPRTPQQIIQELQQRQQQIQQMQQQQLQNNPQ